MNCKKCKTELAIDDVCLSMSDGGYLQIDIVCPKCDTYYWLKLNLSEFTYDLDLEEEQD